MNFRRYVVPIAIRICAARRQLHCQYLYPYPYPYPYHYLYQHQHQHQPQSTRNTAVVQPVRMINGIPSLVIILVVIEYNGLPRMIHVLVDLRYKHVKWCRMISHQSVVRIVIPTSVITSLTSQRRNHHQRKFIVSHHEITVDGSTTFGVIIPLKLRKAMVFVVQVTIAFEIKWLNETATGLS
jgi:hypothetical protein